MQILNMRFSNLKQNKGVAGLSILLSLVVMLFIIGLIVMIFTLMGAEMQDATAERLTAVSVVNETGLRTTIVDGTGATLTSVRGASCSAITEVYNGTSTDDFNLLGTNMYSLVGCVLQNATTWSNVTVPTVSYTYTWSADNSATDVMNDTTSALAGVTSWFSIFIVIGAMVVLILLTVIIITAIRGSGMIEGGNDQGGNVGYA